MFSLPLFPPGSLAASVDATVWLGVCVVCFFNLRLGWVLSGLVVPGYLVPLLLTRPWSAVAILVEAVITYIIVYFFSEYLTRFRGWTNFFGRDRFFALLVTSVLVRLVFDVLIFPYIGQSLNEILHISFDYSNNLHSFGLIVVALIANQFWKPGLIRGMVTVVISTGLTLLLVRYGLMLFTNFSLGSLAYMYEDLAVSMLAGPKAYIILLTTAFVASRMNLKYGWDFNGILIPALLALQWHQPLKILTTVVESLAILALAALVLHLPFFKKITLEGARKLLLFFNLGFVYKLLLGHLILHFFPEQKITDYYGFGYLLTTLLAVKMHDKDIIVRMTRATLQTSLISLFIASFIGFCLTLLPNILAKNISSDVKNIKIEKQNIDLKKIIEQQKIKIYANKRKNSYIPPNLREQEIFGLALENLNLYSNTKTYKYLHQAASLLLEVGYELHELKDGLLTIQGTNKAKSWGVFFVNPNSKSELQIQIPAPLGEWGAVEGGAWLFSALHAHSLAIASTGRSVNINGAADSLRSSGSYLYIFQRYFGKRGVLQLRGYTASAIRLLTGQRVRPGLLSQAGLRSALWVNNQLPDGLDMQKLESLVGPFDVQWGSTPMANILRSSSPKYFTELILNRAGMRELLFKPYFNPRLKAENRRQSIVGYLQSKLLTSKGEIAEKGSELYTPPTLEELLFFDQEILTPLLALMNSFYRDGKWTEEGLQEISLLSASVSLLGYELFRYRHQATSSDYLILSEKRQEKNRRSWGTYVFRLGSSLPLLIQIPRPLSEINVFEYAVSLFERTQARCLLIGGAHPQSNKDGSADLLNIENKQNIFNLVNQVVLRERGFKPMSVVQCRAFGLREGFANSQAEMLVALGSGQHLPENINSELKAVVNILHQDGMDLQFVDGSGDVAGYEAGGIPQGLYLNQTINKEFAVLWLSPTARIAYRQQTQNLLQDMQLAAIGIDSRQGDLFQILKQYKLTDSQGIPEGIYQQLEHYMQTQDISALLNLLENYPQYGFERVVDLNSHHTFLLVKDKKGQVQLVANLLPRQIDSVVVINLPLRSRNKIERYINSRLAWLEIR